ncbi:MAG: multicopper oxidase domain-containing protein [Pseudomonadota bacterium]|uniref:multicopper oxidase domain-containing protein n=1 Tax=Thermithiobacillus tepidarius TaxID=929 RepID=UPI00040D90F5|nr:multicopper oxidase domain-containing protein [Thermithiobacillus tepidarius]
MDPVVPGRLLMLLNGLPFDAPVTETPKRGTAEIWRLINLTVDTHPIHLHLVQFQVLGRQRFDVNRHLASKQLVFTGSLVPPDRNELGYKDTVRVNPGKVVSLLVPFTDFTGRYS